MVILITSVQFAQTEQDSLQSVKPSDSLFIMQKSPWGAVLRSAIFPGWGQFYNESYIKIPVVWGFLGFFVYGWLYYDNLYTDYQTLYAESLKLDSKNPNYLEKREFYRDERDLFAVYIGLAYFLNLVDAYVDAHLFDFDVSRNPYTNSPQFNFRIPF